MNEHTKGKNHPRHHYCAHCNTPAGFWCRTKKGNLLKGWAKQHVDRINKADRARGGQMIGGEFVPFKEEN